MYDSDTTVRKAARITPADVSGVKSLLSLAVGVVVVAALYLAREVLIPITAAVILCLVLTPLVSVLRRARLPHALAVIVAVLVAFGVLGTVGAVIAVEVVDLAAEVPSDTVTIERKVQSIRDMTIHRLSALKSRLDREMKTTADKAAEAATLVAANSPSAQLVQVEQPPTSALEMARMLLMPSLAPLSTVLIVIVVAVFILMQRRDLRDRIIRLFGSTDIQGTTLALDDAGRRLGKYFVAQIATNAMFGVAVGFGLLLIGVPSASLWGVTSAVLRFVPYIGWIIAAVLPAALAAAITPGWSLALWTLGLYIAAEIVIGRIVVPMGYGRSIGLSPAAVVIAAIFWTWIWGPVGLLLSTPLTLCLMVLGRHVDRLEFLDVMLGNRPASTPVENFYQRMLSDDPDEALQQAELLLKDRSLTRYYDEVGLKGLQLAARGAIRGAWSAEKVETFKDNVRVLIDELTAFDDRAPLPDDEVQARSVTTRTEREVPKPMELKVRTPARPEMAPGWRGASAVLCLAGKGPLDEVLAGMLAQLLGKHGLGARVEPYEAASRRAIGTLDIEGVAMICISSLEISENVASLHYLVRRLRQRAPAVAILVGMWPENRNAHDEETAPDDERVRGVVSADAYASSLKQALEQCLRAARSDLEGESAELRSPVLRVRGQHAEPALSGALS